MRTKALVSAVAASAAVTAPAADAHTLSIKQAKAEAAAAGSALARSVGGTPVYDCTRRSKHTVDCQISAVALDGAACVTVVRVAYRNHKSRKVSRKTLSGPECEVPEVDGIH